MAGYLHRIVPEHRFVLTVGRSDMTTYRFGTGRVRHIFCVHCGNKSFYRSRSHPESISINWRCLGEDHRLTFTIAASDGVYPVCRRVLPPFLSASRLLRPLSRASFAAT